MPFYASFFAAVDRNVGLFSTTFLSDFNQKGNKACRFSLHLLIFSSELVRLKKRLKYCAYIAKHSTGQLLAWKQSMIYNGLAIPLACTLFSKLAVNNSILLPSILVSNLF